MTLRTVPIRRSANRHNLFMGGDRELVMFSGLLCAMLVFSAHNLKAALLGLVLWFLSLFLFRAMAKADPQMRHVYLRHLRYQNYYPPRSTPFRENTPAQGKKYQC